MRALSLNQPWASLVMSGEKTMETRSWPPPPEAIGTRIAIHAGKAHKPADERWHDPIFASRVSFATLPYGCVLGSVVIVGVIEMTEAWIDQVPPVERYLGWYEPGRYAWELGGIQQIKPVPWRGAQKLFYVPENLFPLPQA